MDLEIELEKVKNENHDMERRHDDQIHNLQRQIVNLRGQMKDLGKGHSACCHVL